ncbi:hypothetical protein AB0N05_14955 [Nocardia sp. NPDC051030]|uniref:hypothetical protein n=1 Tax=Nocardia sp. NPDC051030 TaxID=3155162 RepID=UPI0034419ED6
MQRTHCQGGTGGNQSYLLSSEGKARGGFSSNDRVRGNPLSSYAVDSADWSELSESDATNHVVSQRHTHPVSRITKRHAVLQNRPDSPTLWVLNNADWQTMLDNSNALKCPEPGCTVRLFPRPKNPKSKVDRHLWLGPNHRGGCDHWNGGSDGGGPMTPKHRWVQDLILTTCRELGYTAIPEHPLTRADVFVTKPATALEVQLRPTAFRDRTDSRRDNGADTIWFVAHDVAWTNVSVREALTQLPSVRFKIYDGRIRWDRDTPEFTPWEDPSGVLDHYADMRILATVFALDTTTTPPHLKQTGMSIREFLDEVLGGQRCWLPPGEAGMPLDKRGRPKPGWVRMNELDQVRASADADADDDFGPVTAPAEVASTVSAPPLPDPVSNHPRPQRRPQPQPAAEDLDGCFALIAVAIVIIAIAALLWWLL